MYFLQVLQEFELKLFKFWEEQHNIISYRISIQWEAGDYACSTPVCLARGNPSKSSIDGQAW